MRASEDDIADVYGSSIAMQTKHKAARHAKARTNDSTNDTNHKLKVASCETLQLYMSAANAEEMNTICHGNARYNDHNDRYGWNPTRAPYCRAVRDAKATTNDVTNEPKPNGNDHATNASAADTATRETNASNDQNARYNDHNDWSEAKLNRAANLFCPAPRSQRW